MKDAVKLMFIPIMGCIAVAMIFLLIIWSASIFIVNPEGQLYGHAVRDIGGLDTFGPSTHCAAIYDPVCGWDSVTYDNACRAVHAGTKVQYNGVCQ